ncbi:unnamed protein product, partial [Hapterophycus canaliculatus]
LRDPRESVVVLAEGSEKLPPAVKIRRCCRSGRRIRAEVGAKNSKGLTPLHVSCLKPNAGMVSLLLLWGADTNARDKKKRTPDQIIGESCRSAVPCRFMMS